ncbi:MAG: HEAT repeat domain-containing protein [Bacteroidetes bacterium]|nr:HEAT repeat domain-containing protein [Bacteroidota bacterium]
MNSHRQRVRAVTCSVLLCGIAPCAAVPAALAQSSHTARWYSEPQYEPPERQVDMQPMRLELQFEPREGLVRGTVTHRFTPLRERVDSLFLHGPGIRVSDATFNGRPARFTTTPGGITVHLVPPANWNSQDSLTLRYEANPRRGLYFIGWKDSTGESRKQIWSQGQGIDNRHWFPCHDEQNDKLTTETIVTFDAQYKVLSNGTRVRVRDNGDGTKTWHYRMSHPHSTYLVMLGIGDYAVEERRSKSGVPLHLWYYPENPERVEPTYRYSAEAVDFMEKETGVAYPWESYAQIPVQDFLYGAMENTTATVFGDFFFVDRRAFLDQNYIGVNVHELAHQWFGDYVTSRAARHGWLHESFATFYPKLFLRHLDGEDAYQWRRRSEHDSALKASRQNRFPILHSQGGRERAYQKGSAVLDMMRYTFGEDAVRRVLTHFLKTHAYGLVESNDLYQAFQDVLGLSPAWFFEQWIYRGGEPHYAVSYGDVSRNGARITSITVRQEHPRDDLVGLFRMPLVFAVYYADGTMDSARVMIERETQTVDIPNRENKTIAFVLFDPGSWVLKTVSFPKTFEELELQSLRARDMIDRYDAVVGMREYAPDKKRAALLRIYEKERFAAMRAEAVTQLVNDANPASWGLVRTALEDPSAEVRRAVVRAVTEIPPSERSSFERCLKDSSYEVVAGALQKLIDQYPSEANRYFEITAQDRGVGNQVRVLRHELRAGLGHTSSLDSLVRLASPAFEFRTRVRAFEALGRLNHLDNDVAMALCDALTHPNGRLRGPAAEVARAFMKQSAYRPLMRNAVANGGWHTWKAEMLQEFLESN